MISAVDRAFALLEVLVGRSAGLSVTELVQITGIEKSVVSRVLATMQADGYVVRDEVTGRFKIGLRFLGIGLRHMDRIGLFEACQPPMQKLADATGELIQLAIEDGTGLTYVAKADTDVNRLRHVSIIGSRAVLHASISGRVWLASLPPTQALQILARTELTKVTPHTKTNLAELTRELKRVGEQGFAIIYGELVDGVNGIAVPVANGVDGQVIGALSLGAPAVRLDAKRMMALLPDLVEVASEIGRSLPKVMALQPFHALQRNAG